MSDSELPEDMMLHLQQFDQQLRDEMRAEASEDELAMAETEMRQQSFADALLDLVNRGDTVQMITPKRTFMGTLVYVGRDFVTVQDPESFIDINLAQPCVVHVVEKAAKGKAKGEGPGSFEMRMYEHKMELVEVEVFSTAIGDGLKGRVTVVGQDHVMLVDKHKESWLFPMSTVSFVIRRSAPRGRI